MGLVNDDGPGDDNGPPAEPPSAGADAQDSNDSGNHSFSSQKEFDEVEVDSEDNQADTEPRRTPTDSAPISDSEHDVIDLSMPTDSCNDDDAHETEIRTIQQGNSDAVADKDKDSPRLAAMKKRHCLSSAVAPNRKSQKVAADSPASQMVVLTPCRPRNPGKSKRASEGAANSPDTSGTADPKASGSGIQALNENLEATQAEMDKFIETKVKDKITSMDDVGDITLLSRTEILIFFR